MQQGSASTVRELIVDGERALVASTSPRLDAELLLGHVLRVSRGSLYAMLREPITSEQERDYRALLARRERGEPLAYITGAREFWGLEFTVTPAVLVPRPESELMIEEALKLVSLDTKQIQFADLGTGSGCLAIALVTELAKRGIAVQCTAVDISSAALSVARENAHKHGVADRISFVQSNWFENREAFSAQYDFFIANPPYVDLDERVPIELTYEPKTALFSESKGLQDAGEILVTAPGYLRPGGVILCEVGAGKRASLPEWFARLGEVGELALLGDDSEADRFTVLKVTKRARVVSDNEEPMVRN